MQDNMNFKEVFIDFDIVNKSKETLEAIIIKSEDNAKKSNSNNIYSITLKNKDVNDKNIIKKLNDIIKIFRNNKIEKNNVSFKVLDSAISYKNKNWNKLSKLNTFFKSAKIEFGFEDGGKVWSIEEVKNSVDAINDIARNISSSNLSPLEILLSTYLEVTKRKYEFQTDDEHVSQSRSIYGIMNSDRIVCVGYSRLFETLLLKQGNPNIKVFQNTVRIPSGRHANCIVYVKDTKYNLEGYYYFDPTWDSSKQNGEIPYNLNYFMLPLQDIKYLSQFIETDIKSEEYIKILNNSSNMELGNDFRKYHLYEGEVTFGRNDFIYDKKFLRDILQDKIYKNTIVDLSRINTKNELNAKLDELDNLINNKKQLDENLKILKNFIKENNITQISQQEFKKMTKLNSFKNLDINKLQQKKCESDNLVSFKFLLRQYRIKENLKIKNLEKDISNMIFYEENLKTKKTNSDSELALKNTNETLKYLSTPITLKKLKHALKQYFIKQNYGTEDDINYIVNEIIKQNIYRAKNIFYSEAKNAFYCANLTDENSLNF